MVISSSTHKDYSALASSFIYVSYMALSSQLSHILSNLPFFFLLFLKWSLQVAKLQKKLHIIISTIFSILLYRAPLHRLNSYYFTPSKLHLNKLEPTALFICFLSHLCLLWSGLVGGFLGGWSLQKWHESVSFHFFCLLCGLHQII